MRKYVPNYYIDEEEIEKYTVTMRTTSYRDYCDFGKTLCDIKTSKYFSKYIDYEDGYTYFELYKIEGDELVFLTQYNSVNSVIITEEMIDIIGDFFYRTFLKLGPELADPLPTIDNVTTLEPSGKNLINPDIKKFSWFE
jgi:hypothetical protein